MIVWVGGVDGSVWVRVGVVGWWDGGMVGRCDGGIVGWWDGGMVGRWDGGTVGWRDGGTVGRWLLLGMVAAGGGGDWWWVGERAREEEAKAECAGPECRVQHQQ